MNGILFAESIEIEFNSLYEACDNAIAYATARFMESDLYPSYYSEAGNKSGGLIGFIETVIKSIGEMLSTACKKIKSVLFGSDLDETKKDDKIEGRDANTITKFLNGYYNDAKGMLKKASKGEISVDEARKFTEDKDSAFGAIGTVITTVGALFASSKISEKYINSWKQELDELYSVVEVEGDDGKKVNVAKDAEEKLARTSSVNGKKDVTDEAVRILLSHVSKTSGFGIKAIEDNIKMLYAKNYIKAKLQKGESEFTDKKALRKAQKGAKKSVKETDKKVDRMEDEVRQIEHASKVKQQIADSEAQNQARLAEARNKRYTDSNKYVDLDDKGKNNYTAVDQIKSGVRKGFDDLKTAAKRATRTFTRHNNK